METSSPFLLLFTFFIDGKILALEILVVSVQRFRWCLPKNSNSSKVRSFNSNLKALGNSTTNWYWSSSASSWSTDSGVGASCSKEARAALNSVRYSRLAGHQHRYWCRGFQWYSLIASIGLVLSGCDSTRCSRMVWSPFRWSDSSRGIRLDSNDGISDFRSTYKSIQRLYCQSPSRNISTTMRGCQSFAGHAFLDALRNIRKIAVEIIRQKFVLNVSL